jgi:hypothetical protein
MGQVLSLDVFFAVLSPGEAASTPAHPVPYLLKFGNGARIAKPTKYCGVAHPRLVADKVFALLT